MCVTYREGEFFFTHQRALGTNPISFGAPANDGNAFVLDMATTAVAVGKVKVRCFIATAQRREIK
jgi:LDH2 family malate/lactate/ureidoglycolate dehydrogenase